MTRLAPILRLHWLQAFLIVCTEGLTKSHRDLPMGHAVVVVRDGLQSTILSSSAGVSTVKRAN
jgi:hypothetical protein